MHFTDDEKEKAYFIWYRDYGFPESDCMVRPFLSQNFVPNSFGKLQLARQGLYLSSNELSKRFGITRSTYCRWEQREAQGHLSLEVLARAAEAMDCELVYAIRPKRRVLFSRVIWQRLISDLPDWPFFRTCHPRRKHWALAGFAKYRMDKPEFRRSQFWTER